MIPEEFRLVVATFALGLRHGWVECRDVVAWADQRIAAASEPHSALLELSLLGAQDAPGGASSIETLFGGRPPAIPESYLLGAMGVVLSRHPERGRAIAAHLWSFTRDRDNEKRPGVVHDLALPFYWYGEADDEPELYAPDEPLNMLREALVPFRFKSVGELDPPFGPIA